MPSSLFDKNNIPEAIAALKEGQDQYLKHLGGAMVEEIDQGFDKGEDALGRPWEPLKTADGQPLVDSGKMRESITYDVDKENTQVAVGGNVEYLQYHEFGTKNLDRRPILQPALTWADQKLIAPAATDVIGERLDMVTF